MDDLDRRVTELAGTIVGWPAPGVTFTDVSRILERHPDVFQALVDRLCDHYADTAPGVIMPIEARGFVYAGAMAAPLGTRLVMARKGPRLPREVVTQGVAICPHGRRRLFSLRRRRSRADNSQRCLASAWWTLDSYRLTT